MLTFKNGIWFERFFNFFNFFKNSFHHSQISSNNYLSLHASKIIQILIFLSSFVLFYQFTRMKQFLRNAIIQPNDNINICNFEFQLNFAWLPEWWVFDSLTQKIGKKIVFVFDWKPTGFNCLLIREQNGFYCFDRIWKHIKWIPVSLFLKKLFKNFSNFSSGLLFLCLIFLSNISSWVVYSTGLLKHLNVHYT